MGERVSKQKPYVRVVPARVRMNGAVVRKKNEILLRGGEGYIGKTRLRRGVYGFFIAADRVTSRGAIHTHKAEE